MTSHFPQGVLTPLGTIRKWAQYFSGILYQVYKSILLKRLK